MSWGASREEWAAWSALGLTEDLLPVVSDPGATVMPGSKLKALGKVPSRYNNNREAMGIPRWTGAVSTPGQVEAWSRDPDLGICLQTRTAIAFDIDIDDPALGDRVEAIIWAALGDLPVRRRRNSGKRLMLVRVHSDERLTKRVMKVDGGAIEMLAHGQQCVVAGTHPSGARYTWDGGPPNEIPVCSRAELESLWKALVEQFAVGSATIDKRGMIPTKPRAASDAFGDPMIDWLFENGWVREFDRSGAVHITCPWDHEHTTESVVSATSYFPPGVGGIDHGAFRCLHAHCAGRDLLAFQQAAGFVADEFEVLPAEVDETGNAVEPPPKFKRDKAGQAVPTIANVVAMLRRSDVTGVRIGYDRFKDTRMVCWVEEGDTDWRPMKDSDYTRLRVMLESKWRFKNPGRDVVRDASLQIAEECAFDSAIDWASTLVWDGEPRVDGFLAVFMGAEDSEYTRAVSRYLWTGLAARCMAPGAQVDMVPVLVGAQGEGKSRGIMAMAPAPETYVEVDLAHRDADLSRSMRGKLIGELAELRGLQSRDAEAIKAWITRPIEEWTPKYIEFATAYPRRAVFIGSSNSDSFLDDETGERRWLPVRVGTIDVEGIAQAREQMWAEAIALWNEHGVQWRDAEVLARDVHDDFKVVDEWTEAIVDWLSRDSMDMPAAPGQARGDGEVVLTDLLANCFGLRLQDVDRKVQLRAGKVLRTLGLQRVVSRSGGSGPPKRVWVRIK